MGEHVMFRVFVRDGIAESRDIEKALAAAWYESSTLSCAAVDVFRFVDEQEPTIIATVQAHGYA